ncbi:MAG: hypothetical protein WBM98_13145 [Maribacter sp.]
MNYIGPGPYEQCPEVMNQPFCFSPILDGGTGLGNERVQQPH